MTIRSLATCALLIAALTPRSAAQCPTTAADGFDLGGVNGYVKDAAEHDLGNGPELFVIGGFNGTSGGVVSSNVASWRDGRWHVLGTGLRHEFGYSNAGAVAMEVYDDGGGPKLYVGGVFTHADDLVTNGVAAWDGSRWHAVGSPLLGNVIDLEVHDDGSGRTLWALSHKAYGPTWLWKLGPGGWTLAAVVVSEATGASSYARCLASFDAGSGPTLFVGGVYSMLKQWNGTSLVDVDGFRGHAVWMEAWDDGTGNALYVGGEEIEVGTTAYGGIARMRSDGWSAVGSGFRSCWSLRTVDLGTGPRLMAVALPTGSSQEILAWDGSTWSLVPGAPPSFSWGMVFQITSLDRGTGRELVLMGSFLLDGSRSIASWDGSSWRGLGVAQQGLRDAPTTLIAAQVAGGSRLLAKARGNLMPLVNERIAAFDGTSWTAFPSLNNGSTLVPCDLGSGPTLLTAADSIYVLQGNQWVARWYNNQHGEIRTGVTLDLGDGPRLFVGGQLSGFGELPYGSPFTEVHNVAGWSQATGWFALGSNLSGSVNVLAGYDDGNGVALYAGGELWYPNHIARWNGTTWETVATGTDDEVTAMAVFDDGDGPCLYVGGNFQTAGGVTSPYIARWDGLSWSTVGAGIQSDGPAYASGYRVISDMLVFDDGKGPALYVGGAFHTAGGVTASNIARWTGSAWEALGSGATHAVRSLEVFDDALYAGGHFVAFDGVPSAGIAKCGTDPCATSLYTAFCESSADACPCGNGGDGTGGCDTPQGTGGVRLDFAGFQPGTNGQETATFLASRYPVGTTPAVLLLRSGDWARDEVPFGDGRACLAAPSRLAHVGLASGGYSVHAIVDQDGAGVRYYQVRYRSNPAAFCDATAAFNTSNAFKITW